MSIFTNKGIKKGLLVDWSQITSIPDRILELAALGDPGGRRYIVWDDTANELVYLELDASEVPYDNGASGLTATNVQDAIDEVYAAVVGSGVFSGYVGSDGSTGNDLPAGWSAVRDSTGRYTITHNLGDTAYAITCMIDGTSTPGRVQCASTTRNANTVQINWYSQTDSVHSDVNFQFHLKLIT